MGRVARWFGCALVAVLAMPALAATISVTKDSDNPASPEAGSLRDAVQKAQSGDTIEIDAGLTIGLKGDLVVPAAKANITIQGKNPPDGQSGKPSTITTAKDADVTAAVRLDGNGDKLVNVACDNVRVTSNATIGVQVTGSAFKGANAGVTLTGTTSAQVGTDAAGNGLGNTFIGCGIGVSVSSTTNTVVGDNVIKDAGTGVSSLDDTNVNVLTNTISGKAPNKTTPSVGIDVSGSSGTVEKNNVTPDKKGGTGIATKKTAGAEPKGPLNLTGNNVKVKGSAAGIDVKDRKDVTISSSDVEGKSSAPGIHVAVGADAGPGGSVVVDGCTVDGCSPGILCDTTGASNVACTISNNTVADCREQGISCAVGADGTCDVTGNEVDRCGSGAEGCGIGLRGEGVEIDCDHNVVDACRGNGINLFAGASFIDLGRLAVTNTKGYAIYASQGATAFVQSAHATADVDFAGNLKGFTFIEIGADLGVTDEILDKFANAPPAKPQIDVAPRGWHSTSMMAGFDVAGNLVVNVPPGAFTVQVSGNGARVVKSAAGASIVTFSPSELPPGAGPGGDLFGVFALHPESLRAGQGPLGQVDVRKPKPRAPDSGTNTFTVSQKNVTITSKIGADNSLSISVTNHSDQPQTLDIGKLTGNFFNFPSGMVTFAPGETKVIDIGHSAMKAVTETANLVMKLASGVVQAVVKVTGITK